MTRLDNYCPGEGCRVRSILKGRWKLKYSKFWILMHLHRLCYIIVQLQAWGLLQGNTGHKTLNNLRLQRGPHACLHSCVILIWSIEREEEAVWLWSSLHPFPPWPQTRRLQCPCLPYLLVQRLGFRPTALAPASARDKAQNRPLSLTARQRLIRLLCPQLWARERAGERRGGKGRCAGRETASKIMASVLVLALRPSYLTTDKRSRAYRNAQICFHPLPFLTVEAIDWAYWPMRLQPRPIWSSRLCSDKKISCACARVRACLFVFIPDRP